MELSTLGSKYINFPINFLDVLSAILLACALSLVVKFVYSFKHNDSASDWRLQDQFYLLGPIISVIMLFIGSNLALSIGLVGSLSIIRFRSAIKSPMDLIYLLWVIAIGLGAGTLNYIHITSATLILCFIVIIKKLLFKKNEYKVFNLLSITGKGDAFKQVSERFKSLDEKSQLLSHNLMDEEFESSYRVTSVESIDELMTDIKSINGIKSVTLINHDNIFNK